MERWLVLVVSGALFVAFGIAVPLVSLNREVEHRYWVDIRAPAGLNWTLWLPMPRTSMTVLPEGDVTVLRETETVLGRLFDVTGKGDAGLAGSLHWFEFDPFPSDPKAMDVALSGEEDGEGFWVWRQSDDAAASIEVVGGWVGRASSLEGSWVCGGPGFQGELPEGWTLLPPIVGDCLRLFDPTPWMSLALGLWLAGPVFLVLGAASRHRHA